MLDADGVRDMLTSFCTVDDVCKANRVGIEELDAFCEREYSMGAGEAAEVFAAQGRAKVHAAQIEAALDGNNSMLILLGKQYLGQSDNQMKPDVKSEETTLGNVLKLYANAKDRKKRTAR